MRLVILFLAPRNWQRIFWGSDFVQPVSFCGRITKINDEKREKQRVDYVNMMEAIEKRVW
jgi:hypothetical protein